MTKTRPSSAGPAEADCRDFKLLLFSEVEHQRALSAGKVFTVKTLHLLGHFCHVASLKAEDRTHELSEGVYRQEQS